VKGMVMLTGLSKVMLWIIQLMLLLALLTLFSGTTRIAGLI